jgi:DNA-binding transcriptional LysR family regulator
MACDLYQLKAFFVLGKTLSFTETAKVLSVTQPAISQAIKKLEAGLGCELIAKRGKQQALTENGMLLYQTCEDVFYRLDKAEESIRRQARDFLGTIRLGATVEFGNHVLVKNMKKFLSDHDNIHVDFAFRHELLPALLSDDLDVIIDCRDISDPRLEKKTIFREKYVVVGAPEYLLRHRIRRPKDLEACRLISMDKDGSWWERFLLALSESERPVLANMTEINHIRGHIAAAREGMGLALVPKYCVTRELHGRRLKDVFPHLALLEDRFFIYQKKKKAALEKHAILVGYLMNIKPVEFGVL